MKHRKSGRKLSRTWEHRKALMRNMVRSLITYERIRTTEAKAKELQPFADKLITLAKKNDLHARREAYKVLESRTMVQRLFDVIGPRYADINGGFTRVVKFGMARVGDAAQMALIEFTQRTPEVEEATPVKQKASKVKKEQTEEAE